MVESEGHCGYERKTYEDRLDGLSGRTAVCRYAGFFAAPAGKGFRLCMQSYTFQRFTLEQAMDKICELGIKYLEIFPGQRFGGYQSVEYECNWEDSVPDIRE